jgi:hypothetical protein
LAAPVLQTRVTGETGSLAIVAIGQELDEARTTRSFGLAPRGFKASPRNGWKTPGGSPPVCPRLRDIRTASARGRSVSLVGHPNSWIGTFRFDLELLLIVTEPCRKRRHDRKQLISYSTGGGKDSRNFDQARGTHQSQLVLALPGRSLLASAEGICCPVPNRPYDWLSEAGCSLGQCDTLRSSMH